jgi:hypothetical protein
LTFWYGLGFDDISNMPMAAIMAYLQELPARQAELKLTLTETEMMPNMKPNARQQALKEWMRTAELQSAARPASPGILKLMGIGVRHVQ